MNARVQDQVTGIVTFVSVSQDSGPAASCNFPAVGSTGTVNCFIDPFPAGTTAVFTLVVNVSPTAFNGQQVLNAVSIDSSATPDPNLTNNAEIETTTVQALQADLAVSKADSPDPVVPGANLTYTITATNNGPNAASSVTVQDPVPFNTTFVSLSAPPGWSCTTPSVGGTGISSCSIGSFPSGGTAIFTLVVHVSPAAPNGSTIFNSAFINNQGTQDPNAANNTGSAQTLVQSADLAVTKTDAPDPVPSGANLTYTITVTNNGAAVAQNVSLSDTVPANTTFVSLAAPGGWMCTTPSPGGTGTVNCTIGSLASGASATFTLVVQVDPGTADGTTITNIANVSSTTGDANPGNNSAIATSTVGPSADLAVTKTDAPDPVPFESNLTYSIAVTNNGPSPADDVTLTDTLPAGTTFVSLTSPAAWSCTTPAVGGTGTVQCGIDPLLPAASAAFTLIVHVVAPPTSFITNTASVASPTHDPNSANNSASATTSVSNPAADVMVAKTDSPDPVTAGTNLTYTITVTNNGPSTAHGVTMTDSLPGGTTFVSLAAPAGWSCSHPAVGTIGDVNCGVSAFASGAPAVFTLVVHVGSGFADPVVANTARVASALTPDPNRSNEESTATTTVVRSADVAVTKADTPDPVTAGSNLTYTVTLTNNGPSQADPTWTDTVPANTTFVSLEQTTGSGFTCTTPPPGGTGTVSCTLAILTVGEVATFTLVVAVDAGVAPGTVIGNTASATATTPDPDDDNNSASVTSTVVDEAADLAVTKTDSPDPVTAGTDLTYTIGVANNGPGGASDVTLSDTLPAGTSFMSATTSQGTCSETAGVLTCPLGSLAAGASATVTLVVRVGASVRPGRSSTTRRRRARRTKTPTRVTTRRRRTPRWQHRLTCRSRRPTRPTP